MKTLGVIVARFQTTNLSILQINVLQELAVKYDQVAILLGVTQVKGSMVNPFDFITRKKMILGVFPSCMVLPISDLKEDQSWSVQLDNLLDKNFPDYTHILHGTGIDLLQKYRGNKQLIEIEQAVMKGNMETQFFSETTILDSEDFRLGIVYANIDQYPKVNATLDIAVFRNGRKEILLGRRYIEGKWRLPGGFSDPADHDFESGALRELLEECGSIEVEPLHYEKSFKINDWRFKNERDKIITLLFSTDIISGVPIGSDDIDEVDFHTLEEISAMKSAGLIVEEHFDLLNHLLQKYRK